MLRLSARSPPDHNSGDRASRDTRRSTRPILKVGDCLRVPGWCIRVQVHAERCFDLLLPAWQPPEVDGLVALVAVDAGAGWADRLLGRYEDAFVVWAQAGADPVGQAMAVARRAETRVAVLLPGGADARRAGLALEVARHLRAGRTDGPGPGWCLTSLERPEPPGGAVRVPHLVSVRHRDVVTDTVVWEVMDREQAEAWSGGPLPDQRFVEDGLAGLLDLRAGARVGRFPATAAGGRLARLLNGRELSIRVVYQRPGLFHVLLSGSRAGDAGAENPPPTGPSGERERGWVR